MTPDRHRIATVPPPTVLLPMTFLLVLLGTPFLWKESGILGRYVQFFTEYHDCLAQLEKDASTKPRLRAWFSGEFYDDSAVLYDESDEIASGHPSEAWKKKAEEQGVVCCEHQHVVGHFYFVAVDLSEGDTRGDMMQGYDLYKSGRISPSH